MMGAITEDAIMPYAQSQGARIYYEETGAGTPILFIHEFGGDHRSWDDQMRHFGRGWRAITWGARGYPPSDCPQDEALYGQVLFNRDAIAVLDAAGIEKAHLIGLSMGGYTALMLAANYPERVLSCTAAGAGSGALSCWLLRAVGEEGLLVSYERRADFAGIARENVERFFGGPHPAWRLRIGDLTGLAEAISPEAISPEATSPEAISPEATSPEVTSPEVTSPGGPGGAGEGDPGPAVEHEEAEDNEPFDRVVLDMVAPWEHIGTAAGALIGGGVICCYVSTVTQLSRTVETVREQGSFDEPAAWESLNRGWHVDGLAVRPGHRMIAHTGFLVTARRLAEGMIPPPRRRRPAKGARDPEAGP
jgi:tRNA A58 N-methylase Trm61